MLQSIFIYMLRQIARSQRRDQYSTRQCKLHEGQRGCNEERNLRRQAQGTLSGGRAKLVWLRIGWLRARVSRQRWAKISTRGELKNFHNNTFFFFYENNLFYFISYVWFRLLWQWSQRHGRTTSRWQRTSATSTSGQLAPWSHGTVLHCSPSRMDVTSEQY